MEHNNKKNFIIDFLYYFILMFLILFFFKYLLRIFLPFIIGGIVAYFSNKQAERICRNKKIKSEKVSPFIAVGICLLIVAVIFIILYVAFLYCKRLLTNTDKIIILISEAINYIKSAIVQLKLSLSSDFDKEILSVINSWSENIIKKIADFFANLAANAASVAPNILFNGVITVIAGGYIAKDYKILTVFIKQLIGKNKYNVIVNVKNILTDSVFKMLKGYLILMLITFVELLVFFITLKIRYSIILAILIAIVDLLPLFGTGTVLIPWGLICVISGKGILGLSLLGVYLVITIIRNFLEPKIIGNQMGVNPFFILIAMFIGLKIASFSGLVLFPVILVVVIKYYKEQLEFEREIDLAD